MNDTSHSHTFFFNDDGFEVCEKCGICTTLRETKGHIEKNDIYSPEQRFSEILINNHIGFVEQIEKEYLKIKSILIRGYPNISLYAYCTYNILIQNFVYYSLDQIANIFKIVNFKKTFCQIERNESISSGNYDLENRAYIRSALHIFLSKYALTSYSEKCLRLAESVKNILSNSQFPFIISISIYLSMSNEVLSNVDMLTELCSYFAINKRTLVKKIKVFKNTKEM